MSHDSSRHAAESSERHVVIPASSLSLLSQRVTVDLVPGLRERRLAREALVTAQSHQFRVGEYSLGIFHAQSRVRLCALWLVKWPWFDRVILFAILAVSVLMAMQNYRELDSPANRAIEQADPYFLAVFTAECVVKIVAYGFVRHPASYLRDGFNRLDIAVVVGGLVEVVLGAGVNLRFLRVARVLRPLRSLNIMKEMKVLVNAMIGSIPKLADVGQAAVFFLIIFAILGMQLFSGVFHRRCRTTSTPTLQGGCWSWPLEATQIDQVCGGRYECVSGSFCGSNFADDVKFGPGFDVQDLSWCDDSVVNLGRSEATNFGITSFDNVGAAFLTVFQSLSLEGWTDIMYLVQDGFNDYAATIYFSIIVLLGSFFIWNLALAVVWDSFQELHVKLTKPRVKKSRGSNEPESPDSSVASAAIRVPGFLAYGWASWKSWKTRDADPLQHGRVRRCFRSLLASRYVSSFFTACIVGNIVVLCLDRYPPPPIEERRVSDTLNTVFTYVFLVEMVLTIVAVGVPAYVSDVASLFDGVLVLVSVVEMASTSSGSAALVFRGLRLFRLFKLAKSWKSFQVLLNAMIRTAKSMYIFALLLGLALFTFALMGMNFFGGGLADDSGMPRANFDYFIRAFATVFQLMTGENWNSVWYSCYVAKGWPSTLYFFAVTLILRFLVMNLFMAILMDRFQQNRDAVVTRKAKPKPTTREVITVFGDLAFNPTSGTLQAESSQGADDSEARLGLSAESAKRTPVSTDNGTDRAIEDQANAMNASEAVWPRDYSLLVFRRGSLFRRSLASLLLSKWTSRLFLFLIILSSVTLALDNPLADPRAPMQKVLTYANTAVSGLFVAEMVAKWVVTGFFAYWRRGWNVLDGLVSLLSISDFVPGGGNLSALKTFRVFRVLRPLRLIARNQNLQVVITTLIKLIPELGNLLVIGALIFLMFGLFLMNFVKGAFASCQIGVGGSLQDFPIDLNLPVTRTCLDSVTGVLSPPSLSGCQFPTTEYFRQAADVPVCVVDEPSSLSLDDYPSVCAFDAGNTPASFLAATSHVVMPCTSPEGLSQTPGCRETMCPGSADVDTIHRCARECSESAGVLFMCHESCPDGAACSECRRQCEAACQCKRCIPLALDAAQCVEQGGAWVDFDMTVNHIGRAMLTLFMTASTEGWVEVMNRAVDSTGVMKQPIRDNNETAWILFFMLFMLICGLFILNLCIGLVVEKFNKIKAAGESVLITEEQQRWIYVQRVLGNQRRFSALNKVKQLPHWRKRLFFFTASSGFESFISGCILLNAVAMAMDSFPEPAYSRALAVLNFVFSGIFLAEMLLKMTALGRSYFSDNWNRFDCFCVFASLVGIGLSIWGGSSVGATIGVVRLLRLARLLRLVRRLKGLNRVFAAFFSSLPKLLNVGVLVVLMLFMYSVLGVQLFAANIRYSAVDDHANFGSFYRSFVSLFRFMTGETWTYFMANLDASPFFLARVVKSPCLSAFDVLESNFASLEDRCLIGSPVKCGNTFAVVLYFVSFVILFSFAILNLFVAVVLEGFDEAKGSNEDEIIDSCVDCWRGFDGGLVMELDLEEAVLFLEAVASQVMRDNRTKRDAFLQKRKMRAAELRAPIIALVTLDFARRAKLKVSHERKVKFMDALESALRILLKVPEESGSAVVSAEEFTLFDHVAAAKIQLRLKIKRMKSRASGII